MRGCVTHHAACDCREAAHARELAEAQAEVERLKAQLGDAHFQRDEAVHFIDEWRAVAEKREAEARAYRTSTQQAEEALGNARIELAEARAEVDRLRGVLDVSAKTLAIQTETAAALREALGDIEGEVMVEMDNVAHGDACDCERCKFLVRVFRLATRSVGVR